MKQNNRTGVVVSIVFLSIAALVVIGLVAAQALGVNVAPQEWAWERSVRGEIIAEGAESTFAGVEEIIVDTADARVTVMPSDVAEVTVTITSDDIFSRQSGSRLRIEQEESFPFSVVSFARSVEIRAPSTVTRLSIDTASGDVNVSGLGLRSLEVDTASGYTTTRDIVCARGFELESVSGGVTAENIQCEEFDVSSTSGEVRARSIFVADTQLGTVSSTLGAQSTGRSRAEIETVSGSVEAVFDRPVNGKIETVSGSVRVTAPQEQGFRLSSVSGSVSLYGESVRSGLLEEATETGGVGRLVIETVSGSITIDD